MQRNRIDPPLRGLRNRVLQVIALYAPGAETFRPAMHRLRGVTIGADVFIGTDAIIETARPDLVYIGNRVEIGIRSVIIAHFYGSATGSNRKDGNYTVRIEDDVFIGPGAIILPDVTIGRGAVVTAGSIVTKSVPSGIMVQGNPAKPVARCTLPLTKYTPLREFYRGLKPLKHPQRDFGSASSERTRPGTASSDSPRG